MKNLKEDYKELYQSLVKQYESIYNLPPLAAKLYTFLLLDFDQKNGYTFNELVEIFKVSKSSISSSITLLLQINQIEYVNQIDCRKRYFRISPSYIQQRLIKYLNGIKIEQDLYEKLLEYRNECKCDTSSIKEYYRLYAKHLEIAKTNLEKTINELNELEN